MNIKSKYQFSESRLSDNFAGENLKRVKTLIDQGYSFNTLAMPGVGVSYFLRYLATRDFAYFIHVDLYSLSNLSRQEFFKLLLHELGGKTKNQTEQEILIECQNILKELSTKQNKIVIIFNRFDQLKKEFDRAFFANIRSLRNISPNQIVMIFTSNKPLYEIAADSIIGANLNFYSKFIYFKPYIKDDLKDLLKIGPGSKKSKNIEQLIKISGGHAQLLNILVNSEKPENLLLDHFVRLQMKELLEYLNYHQKKQVQKIALGKKPGEIDDYLLGVGMVKKLNSGYELFTLLLTEYIRSNLPLRLPVKETKLFKLLRNNFGKVVSKEEIFESVWGENSHDATDWALDALIYRLRRNPAFSSHGYAIENHKKVGYILLQN